MDTKEIKAAIYDKILESQQIQRIFLGIKHEIEILERKLEQTKEVVTNDTAHETKANTDNSSSTTTQTKS